ncbi:MAG: Verru_Chthon cassette protein D [Candidatus Methylacidiphilales bacterium]|nr:Verru_Chthon cassette protein D [Candidatus Methylacidiphilales bacterium]
MKSLPFLLSFCLRSRNQRGYTLLELMVVMGIIALMAVGVPYLGGVMKSYTLTNAGQAIQSQLAFARQEALTSNRAVQVRFYRITDAENGTGYRAIQAFRENTDSTGKVTLTPVSQAYFMPTGIAITDSVANAATLFATGTSGATLSTGDTNYPLPPPYGVNPFLSFRFRPNGQTDLTTSSLFTVLSTRAPLKANQLPAKFITFQIDAVNGTIRVYQP